MPSSSASLLVKRLCLSKCESFLRPFQSSIFEGSLYGVRHASQSDNVMNVFDRKAKRLQRNRTAWNDDHKKYDFLKEEVRVSSEKAELMLN